MPVWFKAEGPMGSGNFVRIQNYLTSFFKLPKRSSVISRGSCRFENQ